MTEAQETIKLVELQMRRMVELDFFGITTIPESEGEIIRAIREGKEFPRAENLKVKQ